VLLTHKNNQDTIRDGILQFFRADEIFSSLCSTIGAQCCHLLKINSTTALNMPDPWARIIEQRYRGLESGLSMARRNLINKTEQLEAAIEAAVRIRTINFTNEKKHHY
jgi:hypothetical protein